jgi:DNA-binding XRE family transcriptional regulator
MDKTHYKMILAMLDEHHPYMSNEINDWRPNGNMSVRVFLKNGEQYIFDSISKTVRKARTSYEVPKDEINDAYCRKSFATHLSELMAEKGYTQHTLAEYTGISKGSINAYLNETKTPSITNLRRIAYALDCSIAELMD